MLRKAALLTTALVLLSALLAGVEPRLAEPRCVRDDALASSARSFSDRGPGEPEAAVDVPYQGLIRSFAGRHGVPAELVESVIRLESNFDPQAVSARGASGLMQLMPATAAALGVRNIFDVEQNLEAGVRYLRALLERFSGDVALAVAAYNAGAEVVKRYGGIPPYPETQQYVDRVLSIYQDARQRPVASDDIDVGPGEPPPDVNPAPSEPYSLTIAFTAVRRGASACG